jgi:hypothetical protein
MTTAADLFADFDPLMPVEEESNPAALPPDPGAPYGRTSAGEPRRKPGRRPGQRNGTGRSTRRKPTAPAKTTGKSRSAAKTPDYAGLIRDALTIPKTAFVWLGLTLRRREFLADAAVLETQGPAFAQAAGDVAVDWPALAVYLEKMAKHGPKSALIACAFPMALQLLTNHGLVPAGFLGTQEPAVLASMMEQTIGVAEQPAAA